MEEFLKNPVFSDIHNQMIDVERSTNGVNWEPYTLDKKHPKWLELSAIAKPFIPVDNFSATKVKFHCYSSILEVVSDVAQRNLAAAAATGWEKEADPEIAMETYKKGLKWIDEMREACQKIIDTNDRGYVLPDRWPTPPEDFVALVSNY